MRSAALAAMLALAPAATPAAPADVTNRFMPGADATQFMLYVSQPIGGRVHLAPRFGLRLERLQAVSAVAGAPFALHMRHRLLIDLQFARDRGPRLEFGERYRLGYDQGAFAFEDSNSRR